MQVIDLAKLTVTNIFALVYGGSGTGKTHLMGTVGELGKVLIVDIDKGIKTLKYAKDLQTGKYLDNITVVSFDSFKDLNELYELVKANDPAKWSKKLQVPITEKFEWIIYDTWSEIQWAMSQKLRDDKSINSSRLDYRKNLEIQHWGLLTDLNKLCVQSLRECPINQIFTMQEHITKDSVTDEMIKGPAIHGKLVTEFPAYFDIVVHTYVDVTGKFGATTRIKNKWPAKTRLGEGTDFTNPVAKDIFM